MQAAALREEQMLLESRAAPMCAGRGHAKPCGTKVLVGETGLIWL